MLSTLLFADEVIETTDLDVRTTSDTKPSDRELSMARQLVSSLSADWEPAKYRDDYRDKVLALLEAKAEGNEFAMPEEPERPAPVVDLDGGAGSQPGPGEGVGTRGGAGG